MHVGWIHTVLVMCYLRVALVLCVFYPYFTGLLHWHWRHWSHPGVYTQPPANHKNKWKVWILPWVYFPRLITIGIEIWNCVSHAYTRTFISITSTMPESYELVFEYKSWYVIITFHGGNWQTSMRVKVKKLEAKSDSINKINIHVINMQ